MKPFYSAVVIALLLAACNNEKKEQKAAAGPAAAIQTPDGQALNLPAPFATGSVKNFSNITGWAAGETPKAPTGFTVQKFADSMYSPRWIYEAPNGDLLVAEANTEAKGIKKVKNVVAGKSKSGNEGGSYNRITLFRDADGDGKVDLRSTFLSGLNQPFGMLIIGNRFYVANTDGVLQYAYTPGETFIHSEPKKILDLPAGGYNNHWTRNLLASPDNKKIYVTVGSGSNVAEHGLANEVRRAAVLEINPDGSGEKVYATGLRNPVGMGWAPGTTTLWTAVNERDGLGDDLVPDYATSVKEGGFYGWPFSYYGSHPDPRMKDDPHPELVQKALVPDVALGSHTASLGLAFDKQGAMAGKYKGGMFIGQHGSWNRSALSGYKVVFVPFANGKPAGAPEDFLTGFITGKDNDVHGRPVGVAITKKGYMLVADDAANVIWMVKGE